MSLGIKAAEAGLVPDFLLRSTMRKWMRRRLDEQSEEGKAAFLASLREAPVAILPEKANEQHYEVPAAFYEQVLGKRRKYSSAYWPDGVNDLDAAEEAMLQLSCERAELEDGMDILELGCGWGSLSLWMAEKYPNAKITSVSNSHSQRESIMARAPGNLTVETADMNDFATERVFDRVVSIEMFEHMRNYEELLRRVAGWLRDDGKLFLHVFCHKHWCYPFETEGDDNWLGRWFFTGGLMPSHDLFTHFQDDLTVESLEAVGGEHYAKTAEAWLQLLDERRDAVRPILGSNTWIHRWRLFFMACAELFGYDGGREWHVSHIRMSKQS